MTARPGLVGVLAAIAVLVGGSWYQATVTPPYRFIDEQAHAGYVLAIQSGHLPDIDTAIDAEAGGVALRTRLATEPERRRDVWVANNPPLTYVVAAVPAAATRALGLPGGPLLGLRLVNVAAVAAAVALSYLLARDLAGGDRTVGLVAAGLVALTPHLGFVAALGFNDGMALLATTGVAWALARVTGAGAAPGATLDRSRVVQLGLWCAFAALVRPMALVVAVVAGALALAWIWWRRLAPPLWSAAWLVLPTAIGAGWFYVVNLVRYGDPTGSAALFEKFGRTDQGTLLANLRLRGVWEAAVRTIATRRLEVPLPGDPYGWYRAALVVLGLGLLGAVALVAWSGIRNRHGVPARASRLDPAAPLPVVAWLAVAAISLVPVVLTAQHRAGGGAPHPRYLLPMVPLVAAAVALAVVRLATRWAAIGLLALVGAMTWRQTRASARWLAENPSGPPGSELVTAYGTELVRGAGLALAVVGLVALLVVVARDPAEA
ncbi:MAG: hypothetical protein KDA98_08925 [Acidimicrobiales bacterium]|nr:hypothetical protein [Acidimicrobiales bacterium]